MNKIIYTIILSIAIIAAFFTLAFSNIQISNAVTIILTAILVIVTLYYASSTKNISQATEKNVWQQALLELQKEYGSREMMDAISHLWHFYRSHCKEDVTILKKEFRNLIEKNLQAPVNLSRRRVLFFYLHLAVLYKHRILFGEVIFDMFSERDLEIIPKILIPIDEESQDYVDELDNRPKKKLHYRDMLLQLYNDSQTLP